MCVLVVKRYRASETACHGACHLCVRNSGRKREKAHIFDIHAIKKPCKSMNYTAIMCPGLDSNQHTLASAAT